MLVILLQRVRENERNVGAGRRTRLTAAEISSLVRSISKPRGGGQAGPLDIDKQVAASVRQHVRQVSAFFVRFWWHKVAEA